MININNSIKNIFVNNNLPSRQLSFKADTQDVFTKNTKDEQATTELKRRNRIKRKLVRMDSNKTYKQVNKNLNPNKMGENLKARILAFPFVLKGILALIPTYLSQKIDADTFSQVYLERTPHLFTRLDYGKDKEAFAKDFEHEIAMVKNVNVACDNYRNGEVEQDTLDSSIEKNLEEYLKTPENNEVFYLE